MADITTHEGSKYLRPITSPLSGNTVQVDVYAVLEAFQVTCPARAHAIKKLLCTGTRGKGDALADLKGALAAVNRSIELEGTRQAPPLQDQIPPLPSGSLSAEEVFCDINTFGNVADGDLFLYEKVLYRKVTPFRSGDHIDKANAMTQEADPNKNSARVFKDKAPVRVTSTRGGLTL